MSRRFLPWFVFTVVGLISSQAQAGKYDLDLTGLGELQGNGTVVKRNDHFRSLSSELGTVMAPKPVDPGDSLGLSGFAVAADFSLNTIGYDQDYWSATSDGADQVTTTMQIVGRKGLWPGLEVGGGTTHLFDSRMWTISGYAKAALHEGFHHLPIPTIALRAQFGQLLGAKNFKMTTISPGVAVSHIFGAGKTVNITPYVGYEALLILARSTVLDSTPYCDEYDDYNEGCDNLDDVLDPGVSGSDVVPEFVFKKQKAIVRHRPHLGLRFIFSVIRITVEAMFVPPGGSSDTVEGESVSDSSKFQQQYTLSLGLDF